MKLLFFILGYVIIQNGKSSTKGSRPVQGTSATHSNTNYNIQLQIQTLATVHKITQQLQYKIKYINNSNYHK